MQRLPESQCAVADREDGSIMPRRLQSRSKPAHDSVDSPNPPLRVMSSLVQSHARRS